MGVYIKDMEMPGSCNGCKFWSITSCIASYQGEKSCPLVSAPEPHGRLIDADKLKETLDYYISEAGWSDEINKVLSWVKDEFIDSEQTVIPASEEAE